VSVRSREGERLAQRLESTASPIAPGDLAALGTCVDGVARAFADALEALNSESLG
jgi:hypothetical protein